MLSCPLSPLPPTARLPQCALLPCLTSSRRRASCSGAGESAAVCSSSSSGSTRKGPMPPPRPVKVAQDGSRGLRNNAAVAQHAEACANCSRSAASIKRACTHKLPSRLVWRSHVWCSPAPAARANTRTTAARSSRLSLVSAAAISRRKEAPHGSMAVASAARYRRSDGGAC